MRITIGPRPAPLAKHSGARRRRDGLRYRPGRAAAAAPWYVARILAGAEPAELPVEQPARCESAVNLRTARALKLKRSQTLLRQVTEWVE